MPFLGDLERLLADLYPYRVPLTGFGLLVVVLIGWFAVRRGWHLGGWQWARAHRVTAPLIGGVVLIVAAVGGDYLLSPLWERTTLDEASPVMVAATAAPAETAAVPSSASRSTGGASTGATVAATSSDAAFAVRVVSEGEFSGADEFHFGEGRALIIEVAPDEYILRFEEFSVRNGPDLFVYLSSEAGAPSADAVKLGALKATDGAFNYEIPAGVDVGSLGYAMIWCDQFAVLFATAPLIG
jgi:electron transfer DM13